MTRVTVFVLSLSALACSTAPPPAAQGVRVTSNPEVVRGCQFVRNVRDTGSNAMPSPAERVENMLRVQAAKLGGNVLMIASMISTGGVTTGSGEAYMCPQPGRP